MTRMTRSSEPAHDTPASGSSTTTAACASCWPPRCARPATPSTVSRTRATRWTRCAQRGAPDLLFTDVRMPGDDGLVLLDDSRRSAPQLPVIVMSAYTDVASTAGAFRGGAHEFLSKPFDLDDAVALAARTLAAMPTTSAAADAGAERAPTAAMR